MDNSLKKTPYFDRRTTNIIKGIALLMMLIHHFFTFPGWWGAGISYPMIEKFAPYFRAPLRLCVPIFCFITGYFYFFQKDRSYKYSVRKISDLLISYWCVFFIFAILAATLAEYRYTVADFLLECVALKTPTMYFCWYVFFYIVFMLTLPLITKILGKNIHVDLLIGFAIFPLAARTVRHFIGNEILLTAINDFIAWFPMVLLGYSFAAYGLFEKLGGLNRRLIKNRTVNAILMIAVALLAPMGRYAEPYISVSFSLLPPLNINTDCFYAPLFIYAIVTICDRFDISVLKNTAAQIGKYSMLMWFVSCIFFNNCQAVFQPILYFPRNPIIVTIWGTLLCFGVSYFLDIVIKKIQKAKNKLFVK